MSSPRSDLTLTARMSLDGAVPYSRAWQAIDSGAVIMSIMLVFVLLRVYARAFVTKLFGADDWMCVISTIITVGYTGLAFNVLLSGGLGVHQWTLTPATFDKAYFNRLIASQTIYPWCTGTIKMSFLLLFRRIFGTHERARFLIYLGMVVSSLFYFVTFILTLVWCAPPPGGNSMVSAAGPACQVTAERMSIVQAGFNLGSDFYLLVIPIPIVWELSKVSVLKKVGVCAIFLTGLFATICSVLTMYFRLTIRYSKDQSWDYVPVYIVSLYEINVGIICSCMPCIPILFRSNEIERILSLGSWLRIPSVTSIFSKRSPPQTERVQNGKDMRGRFGRTGSDAVLRNPSSLEMGDYPEYKQSSQRGERSLDGDH